MKAHVLGMIGGAIILTLFGGFWCIGTLDFWPGRPGWAIPTAALVTALLLVVCFIRLKAGSRLPSTYDPVAVAKGKRVGLLFGIIFGAEGILIGVVSTLLARSGHGLWIPVAVALIVGLHFLPLARVFEAPLYYWTGSISVLGVLGCLLIDATDLRLRCVGFVMASVLWGTAVVLLGKTRLSQA